MHARVVNYNDGIDSDLYSLVTREDGDLLDLLVWDGGTFQAKAGVPRREPDDYGPEGGGDTWSERSP